MPVSADDLVKAITKHKDFLGKFATVLDDNYTMYSIEDENGKQVPMTPREWGQYFKVEIPESPTPGDLLSLQSKMVDLFDKAMFYLAHSQLIMESFEEGSTEQINLAIANLVRTHDPKDGRLPAAATLQAIASADNDELIGGKAAAAARVNFWKHIVRKLERQMKLLEEARWTMHTDAKHIEKGRGLPDDRGTDIFGND